MSEALTLARELGATLALGGRVLPPEVMRLLERWVRLARKRLEAEGWIDEMAAPRGALGRLAGALFEYTDSGRETDGTTTTRNEGIERNASNGSNLTEQDVLAALKGVKDPEIHRDLVDLGWSRTSGSRGRRWPSRST